jgi:hypothetical protein
MPQFLDARYGVDGVGLVSLLFSPLPPSPLFSLKFLIHRSVLAKTCLLMGHGQDTTIETLIRILLLSIFVSLPPPPPRIQPHLARCTLAFHTTCPATPGSASPVAAAGFARSSAAGPARAARPVVTVTIASPSRQPARSARISVCGVRLHHRPPNGRTAHAVHSSNN